MKKIIIGVAVLAMVAVAVIVINHDGTDERYTVKLGSLPIVSGDSHFVAQAKGWYEEAGIKVAVTEFQTSNQMYDALAKGDIDVTTNLSSVPVLINHIKDPGRVRIFTMTEYVSEEPFDQVVVKGASPIRTLADLAGKKVGVFPGSTATAFLKDYLSKHGVDITGIEFVALPPANQVQALEAGSIDALYAYEPDATRVLVTGGRSVSESVYASYVNRSPIGIGVLSAEFISGHPALAEKVVDIYDRAADFARANEQEAKAIVADSLGLDAAIRDRMSLGAHAKSTELDQERYQRFIDVLRSFNELPSQPDLATLFYER